MNYSKYRKHPRVYSKKHDPVEKKEKTLNISAGAAIGILAFTFAKGIFWGYLLKRKQG